MGSRERIGKVENEKRMRRKESEKKEREEGRGTVISEEKDILDSTRYFPYCTTIPFPLNQCGLGGRPVGQAS